MLGFRKRKQQTLFLFCPHCGYDLVRRGRFIYDAPNGVYFRCSTCHRASLWNLDTPGPYPIWPGVEPAHEHKPYPETGVLIRACEMFANPPPFFRWLIS